MPAIKTLKLLAHGDNYRPNNNPSQQSYSLARTSSLNTHKDPYEKNLTHAKSLRILSSRLNVEQSNDSSEKHNDENRQQQTETDDGDS